MKKHTKSQEIHSIRAKKNPREIENSIKNHEALPREIKIKEKFKIAKSKAKEIQVQKIP